jgi:hypothetical protein
MIIYFHINPLHYIAHLKVHAFTHGVKDSSIKSPNTKVVI